MNETNSSGASYEEKLAAWKSRHGITNTARDELTTEDIMQAEDAKSTANDYCWRCGNEFPVRLMIVDTDPFIQCEDSPHRDDGYIPEKYRRRVCRKCHEADEEE